MPKGNRDVAVVVGSLRKGSITRKVARALSKLAPEGLKCEIVEYGDPGHAAHITVPLWMLVMISSFCREKL